MEIHKTPIQKDRVDFTGTREQIAGDFATARKLGAAEIVIYAQFLPEGESARDLVREHGRSLEYHKATLTPFAGCRRTPSFALV